MRQPKPSPVQVADVHTQMGDWYQTRLQHERALPQYKLAWVAAEQAPILDGKSLRELLFGKPILLHYTRPTEWDRYARRPADEVVAHTVEIDLTVSTEGRVRGRKLVSNEGDAHMAEEALEAADTARYRPRFVDGNPVETPDVRLTQTYYEPIETPKNPEATESPSGGAQPAGAPATTDKPKRCGAGNWCRRSTSDSGAARNDTAAHATVTAIKPSRASPSASGVLFSAGGVDGGVADGVDSCPPAGGDSPAGGPCCSPCAGGCSAGAGCGAVG